MKLVLATRAACRAGCDRQACQPASCRAACACRAAFACRACQVVVDLVVLGGRLVVLKLEAPSSSNPLEVQH